MWQSPKNICKGGYSLWVCSPFWVMSEVRKLWENKQVRFKRSLLECVTSHEIPKNDSQIPCWLAKLTPKECLSLECDWWKWYWIFPWQIHHVWLAEFLGQSNFYYNFSHAPCKTKQNKIKNVSTFKRLAISPLHKPVTPFIFTVWTKALVIPLNWISTPPWFGRRLLLACHTKPS